MRHRIRCLALAGVVAAAAAVSAVPGVLPAPPVAERRPHELVTHGDVRVDDYYWLCERGDPQVIAYLEAENAYAEAVLTPLEPLRERLFDEIKGRIPQNDASAPLRLGDYLYYTRYREGGEYPIHCRRRGSMQAAEEVFLDVNELAADHDYYDVRSWAISPNQQVLAFAADTTGRRICTVHFKDLSSGRMLPDRIDETTHNLAWAEDDVSLFYTRQDPQTLRWDRVYRHALGSDAGADALVYREPDETFDAYVFKTRSRAFVVVGVVQTVSNEYRFVRADRPDGELRLFAPRQREHEYQIDHAGEHFYILSNDGARNFRLLRTSVTDTRQEKWEEVIGHREEVLLEEVALFRRHLMVAERENGLLRLRIREHDGSDDHVVDFGEPTYRAEAYGNWDFDTTLLRYRYQSLTTPESDFDYDMATRQATLVKREAVLGGDFDPASYHTDRLWATAADGTRVPISIVYRKGFPRDGSGPLLLYGYGSYGASMDAAFVSSRLSLLDRGFAFAIAHVRGGQELGRAWYDGGRLRHKRNTFTDFIDCAEHLIDAGYTRRQRLFAHGGSAGGLLMGAVMNLRPDLFHGVVAAVPFVDVLTTMLDDTIPLTTSEYDEWGNPNVPADYDYIRSYSPYDNLAAGDYPHLLVLAGLHDSQVQYWEPAKWVARQRALRTDSNRLLLKTEMEAGHGGPSGRYRKYRETALIYAFLLDLAGAADGGGDRAP